jgi:lipopolysaccharide export system permease protein
MAEDCYYQPARGARPSGYLFRNVTHPLDLLQKPSLTLHGEPVVITPVSEPKWLKPTECFVVSQLSFEQLMGGRGWRQYSSTPALIAGLQNRSLDFGADVRVAIHSRMVQPFLDLTLLFLGLPLVLSRENRNMFMAVGLCLAMVAGFMLVVLACQYLGASLLVSPALAAWLPLMVFAPAAVAMYDRVER